MTRVRTAFVTMLPLLAMAFATCGHLSAQENEQQELQAKYVRLRDEKMALHVFKKSDWTFDYDEARKRAAESGKVIFTYFTRSYRG